MPLRPSPPRASRPREVRGDRRLGLKGRGGQPSRYRLEYQAGRSARKIEIAVGIKTNGTSVNPVEQHGNIDSLHVSGGFVAAGGGFYAMVGI